MRPLVASLVCAACLAALGSTTAQAGSTVRDFDYRVGDVGGTAAARSSARTKTITVNPHQAFDLAGFRWAGSAQPYIRIQSHGKRGWSDWVTVSADADHAPDAPGLGRERGRSGSDPAWTGPADRLRLRVRGNVRDLRVHFVDLRSVDLHSKAGKTVRASANTGGVSPLLPAPGKTGTKAGGAPPPPFVSRSAWGADKSCKPRSTPAYGEVLGAAVHHTVSTNSYSQAQAPGVVLAICRYHRNSNGWHDIGYNALVDRFGTIYEGRGGGVTRAVAGAHAQGYNGQTTGVALIGNHTSSAPSAAALASLRSWLAWKLPFHGVTRAERVALNSTGGKVNRFRYGRLVFARPISGHRNFDSTGCPGQVLYDQLAGLQSILAPSSRTATRMSVRLRAGAAGSKTVLISGRLRGGGISLTGREIEIQTYGAAGWTTLQTVTTDQDGIYRAGVVTSSRIFLRGAFMGNGTYRPVRSIWSFSPKVKQ